MKRIIFAALVMAVMSGCGTARYRVIMPTDNRHTKTELQWDVVEVKFNDIWKKVLGGE